MVPMGNGKAARAGLTRSVRAHQPRQKSLLAAPRPPTREPTSCSPGTCHAHRNRRAATNKASRASSGTPPTRPLPTTPWPNDDNRAASHATTCRIRSIWRRRGTRGVSLVPMGNGKAARAGLTRSVRAHRFDSSSPVTGGAHQHFPAKAEDEGDLEPLPIRPQRDRRVELRHLSRPRHAPSALHGAPPVLRC